MGHTRAVVAIGVFCLVAVVGALPNKDIHAKPNYHFDHSMPIARAPAMPPATQLDNSGYGGKD